jgi:hypothetical protein
MLLSCPGARCSCNLLKKSMSTMLPCQLHHATLPGGSCLSAWYITLPCPPWCIMLPCLVHYSSWCIILTGLAHHATRCVTLPPTWCIIVPGATCYPAWCIMLPGISCNTRLHYLVLCLYPVYCTTPPIEFECHGYFKN